MIIGETFVWFHLGKTGGKTTRSMISCIENEKLKKNYSLKIYNNQIFHHANKATY